MGSLLSLLSNLISIYTLLIFVRVLLSWIPGIDRYNSLVQLLYQMTDPVLEPARRFIPPLGGLDLSPIVVLIALQFIASSLSDLARQFS